MADAAALNAFWRITPRGLSLAIKVQPKARRVGPQGIMLAADGPRLRIGVSAAAEAGKANRAACEILAEVLDVPLSAVSVAVGHTNKEKIIHVTGPSEMLIARLAAL